jgi:photosystem II stability/assembly factor-like uncharacterized protein
VLDENTIFAVGDRGTLLRSDNGGADWEITHRLAGISENIVDIQFVSEQKGFLLANKFLKNDFNQWIHYSSKILVTEDSGTNWEVIAEFDSLKLNDLFFVDENVGWAVGLLDELGIILKSIDGGYNWETIFEQNISYSGGFSTIQFIDLEIGWAVGKPSNSWEGNCELLKTTDGGFNWIPANDSFYIIASFQFLNESDGWLIESRPPNGWSTTAHYFIKRTNDGGLNWEDIFARGVPYYSFYLPSLYFMNPDTGWVQESWTLQSASGIKKTTDRGLSWHTVTMNTPSDGAMHFSDELNGSIVGKNGEILSTQDGGQSWIERSTMITSRQLLAVDFHDDTNGWVTALDYTRDGEFLYTDGILYSTTNGGSTWIEQLHISGGKITEGIINAVQSINDQLVYAAGLEVYKTTDGGTNWNILNDPVANHYNTLFFLNADTGFVGSDIVYKTTNGGIEWDSVLSVQGTSIESIFFTNNSIGWALVGNYMYKTTDEGDTWQEIAETNLDLHSIYFANENVGLAVGKHDMFAIDNYGVIIRTTNGGYNWDEIYSMDCYDFKSVYFIDSGKAIVVGREGVWPYYSDNFYGVILSVDDVGGNCVVEQQSWTPGLNDVHFLNNNTGWAVGDGGTIIKTTSGVSFVEEEEIDEIPIDYNLANNFPNPFNPTTTIQYSVKERSSVELILYDLLGREVEVLVNEEQAAGNYKIQFNAVTLPSGIYFYRIQAGTYLETKKMLLLK